MQLCESPRRWKSHASNGLVLQQCGYSWKAHDRSATWTAKTGRLWRQRRWWWRWWTSEFILSYNCESCSNRPVISAKLITRQPERSKLYSYILIASACRVVRKYPAFLHRKRSIPSQELWYSRLAFVIMLSCKKGVKISERSWLRALKLHVNSLEVKSRSIAKLQGLPTILAIPSA